MIKLKSISLLLIESQSINSMTRWVGVVDSNGSVSMPKNQNGQKYHSEYGWENSPNKFCYWPKKQFVSWWTIPEDKDIMATVEDFLFKKGYDVKYHSDVYNSTRFDTILKEMVGKNL